MTVTPDLGRTVGWIRLSAIGALIATGGCSRGVEMLYDLPGGAAAAAVDGERVAICGIRQSDLRVVTLGGADGPKQTVAGLALGRSGAGALAVRGRMVLAAVESGLRIFEVSDDEPPQLFSSLEEEALRGHSVLLALSDDFAALSHSRPQAEGSDSVGISLIDLRDLSVPRVAGTIELPLGSDNVGQMVIEGSILFVAARGSGLWLYDVGDPSSARLLSRYDPGSWTRGVATEGDFAYVTVSMTQGASSVQTLDISDPTDPQLVDSQDTPGIAQRLAVSAPFLYVADREAGLRIYDISNAGEPQFTTLYRRWASDVAASGSLVVIWDVVRGSAHILRHSKR